MRVCLFFCEQLSTQYKPGKGLTEEAGSCANNSLRLQIRHSRNLCVTVVLFMSLTGSLVCR